MGGFWRGMKFMGEGRSFTLLTSCYLLAVGLFKHENDGISSKIFVFSIDSLS